MYGVGIIIEKPANDTDKVSYILAGGFDAMAWYMAKDEKSPERVIQRLNNMCKKVLREEPRRFSTLDKLSTAPCDFVLMITGESSYECLENREPLDCSKGSGNEHIGIEEYIRVD